MWWTEPDRLGRAAHELLAERSRDVHFSAISVWEIANKSRLGKLPQVAWFETEHARLVRENGFVMLNVTGDHALRAGYLPGDHRDPFDRLIAGQALVENMTVLTNDPQIGAFGCQVLW